MEPLTHQETLDYNPPPCPHCGGKTTVQFVDVLSVDQNPDNPNVRRWLPGTYECTVQQHDDRPRT